MATEENAALLGRAGSFESSSSETGTLVERESAAKLDTFDDDVTKLRSPDDLELGEEDDGEDDMLLPEINEKGSHDLESDSEDDTLLTQANEKKEEPPKASFRSALIWMVTNTLATIGIVGQN